MQDSISQLEEELAAIDAENSRLGIPPVNNGSFRHEKVERREEILIEAHSKLKEYSVLAFFSLVPPPTTIIPVIGVAVQPNDLTQMNI